MDFQKDIYITHKLCPINLWVLYGLQLSILSRTMTTFCRSTDRTLQIPNEVIVSKFLRLFPLMSQYLLNILYILVQFILQFLEKCE